MSERPVMRLWIDGYVLVGGESSRMGRSKPNIELGGAKLFEFAVSALGPFCDDKITLVGAGADQLAAGSSSQLNSIPDVHLDTGVQTRAPIVGAYSAFVNAQNTYAAILACDLPFATVDLIEHLVGRISAEVDAVVPLQSDGRPQPLCAIYNVQRCIPIVEEMLFAGDLKMHDLLSRVTVRYVPFSEISDLFEADRFFLNVNRPEDLERARSVPLKTPA